MRDNAPIYQGRFTDRSPCIRSAGKLLPIGERAASCLSEIRPTAGSLLNPRPKTLFQQKLIEKSESLYSSPQRSPLGKPYAKTSAFPASIDPHEITFGKKNIRGLSARTLLNPPKSVQEIVEESKKGHELYVVTHNDYDVGEIRDRKYDWTKYNKDKRFGIETPHYNDGRSLKRCVQDLSEKKRKEGANIVSKRVDDFRERTQPQIGKVLDPIADTRNLPPDHTFGARKYEKYGVGDILHSRSSMNFQHVKDRYRGILAAVQQHMKKLNYHNFGSLLEAFRHYDKNGDGKIDKEELKSTCFQFGLDMDSDLLDSLLEYCDADKDGLINFVEFANFLNWKDKMSITKLEEKILTQVLLKPADIVFKEKGGCEKTPKTLSKAGHPTHDHFRTSSSKINAIVGGPSSASYRTCGIPTVRTDLAAPRIRRIGDRTNYGDESDAKGLLCPSVFSQNMVYERDFFRTRPKEEISQILRNIGVSMPDQNFDELWSLASKTHPKGEVSIETMRNVLNSIDTAQKQRS
ncbi:EF-hand domain-containing family member B [Pelodytes ibericus]